MIPRSGKFPSRVVQNLFARFVWHLGRTACAGQKTCLRRNLKCRKQQSSAKSKGGSFLVKPSRNTPNPPIQPKLTGKSGGAGLQCRRRSSWNAHAGRKFAVDWGIGALDGFCKKHCLSSKVLRPWCGFPASHARRCGGAGCLTPFRHN